MKRHRCVVITLAAVVAIVVLLLVSCSSAPQTGRVYNKQHFASYTWVMTRCAVYGKKGNCLYWSYIPITEPERWKLCLRNGDDSGCREVDHDTWNRYHVGDWYVGAK